MRVYVGVDGGGTNTDAAIISESGEIVARLSGGPTNPHSVPLEQALSELQRVLEQLFNLKSDLSTNCEGICLGMSGVDTIQERQLIADTVNNYMKSRNQRGSEGCPVWVVSEGEIALMATLGHTHGVLCISGTGSIVYGFTLEGERYRAGGWGHLLGDEGSGYRIGQRALQVVMQSYDGVLPPTRLTPLLLKKLKLRDISELKTRVYQMDWGKTETASIARLAIEAAESGDKAARALIIDEASQLADTAKALIARHPEFASTQVVLSGSLFRYAALFRNTFIQKLSGYYGKLDFVYREDAPDPVVGAAQLARRRCSLNESF
ncbi:MULTISPECIES: N-acetylglucosamine kinase [unclassified Paenibacillus]|uniref:N-acetylglucosamine kinase n=1 Tax=unclassified Paenibacillus TaxID=185978 RepID=UPI0008CB3CE0|nr:MULTISPECIES: BadF/BadG/BcrA/BcrD ATPase family protein [unclassified Paenibacillus]QLG37326.1 N-acetylglucosamine kinase [Paenibacillus sp. E222]SEO92242.1 BadF-type ATPase [Paenibacillus sp. OK076]